MLKFIRHIILFCLWLVVLPAYPVNVTARGKFNLDDHESFSGIPTEILFNKGISYLENALTEPDSAMMCFSIVANRYENNPTRDEAPLAVGSLINISYLWRESYYDYARAYSTNLKALKIAEENNVEKYMPYIYMGMTSILQYVDIGDSPIDSPTIWFGKALKAAVATKNETLIRYAIINLCEMAITQGMTPNIRGYYNLIKNYIRKESTHYDDYTNCFLSALESLDRNDKEGVVRQLNKALALTPPDKPTDEKVSLMTLKLKIAAMKGAGQNDSIPLLLKSMLSFASDRSYQEYTLYALKGLSDYYAEIGDRKTAHEFDYQYLHINDSLQRLNNVTRVKDIAFISGLEEAQDDVRKLTIQKRHNEIIALSAGMVAVIIILSLILYIRNQKKLNEANLSLYNRLQNDLNQKDAHIKSGHADNNPQEEEARLGNEEATPASGVSPEHAEQIFNKVRQIMETAPEIYADDFSINTLANLVGEPAYAVSAAINYCSGSNFKTILLGYRLREACRRLSDNANYSNQTIESIALGLGFKSRTYFISVFKKHTGLTPAVYMKLARAKQEDSRPS